MKATSSMMTTVEHAISKYWFHLSHHVLRGDSGDFLRDAMILTCLMYLVFHFVPDS